MLQTSCCGGQFPASWMLLDHIFGIARCLQKRLNSGDLCLIVIHVTPYNWWWDSIVPFIVPLSSLILPLQMAPSLSLVNSSTDSLWLARGLQHSVSHVISDIPICHPHSRLMLSRHQTNISYSHFLTPHTFMIAQYVKINKVSTLTAFRHPELKKSIYFEFTELTHSQDFYDQTRYAKRERKELSWTGVICILYAQ